MDIGSLGFGLLVTGLSAVKLSWYVAVMWLLFRIWAKVRHLPG
jgi:hypothetical protein